MPASSNAAYASGGNFRPWRLSGRGQRSAVPIGPQTGLIFLTEVLAQVTGDAMAVMSLL